VNNYDPGPELLPVALDARLPAEAGADTQAHHYVLDALPSLDFGDMEVPLAIDRDVVERGERPERGNAAKPKRKKVR
jgi:hypothetical protein